MGSTLSRLKKVPLMMLAFVLLFALVSLPNRFAFIHLAHAADAHGNDIQFIEVHQYNGTDWNLVVNFTSTGGSSRVHDGWVINFTVSIKFNATLASSTAQAIDYTRVYMNISEGVWTNALLNNTACSLVGSFYILTEEGHWNQTGDPVAGTDYNVDCAYEAYS